MKGVDTNILVRFLVGDDPVQSQKVYELFKKTEQEKGTLFVPLVVILELIWVLESAYEIPRDNIVESISDMLLMPILKFEHRSALQRVVGAARQSRCDLADLVIACSAHDQGCETVWTFDKRASAFTGFDPLSLTL